MKPLVILLSALGTAGVHAQSTTVTQVVSSTSSPSSQESAAVPRISDPASLVLPFIGTTNGGHVFPGATLPHGMAKVGMDTDSPGNHAGYDANPIYNVTGFSQLHDTGTGGSIPLSNFKIWPFSQCSEFQKCPTAIDSRKVLRSILPDGSPDDYASPGYFSTNLSTSIRVELTSTRRTALHRYTFPAGTEQPRIAVDITNDGQFSSTNPVMTLDPDTAQVQGGAEFAASFGPGRYTAYTCVDFAGDGYTLDKPTEYGVWLADYPILGTTNILQVYYGFVDQLGALFTFNPAPNGQETKILVRVGVSLISSQQACANAQEEIPDFDFEGVTSDSRAEWNELLGRVQVDPTGVPLETLQLFYSSLYRTHVSPADYTGENPKWESTEPYYDSLYCNWDTFRTLYPLMSLHDPVRFADVVRGMVNIQQHEGWLPDCRGATAQHFIQGGNSADVILGEFFVKFHEQAAALNVSADNLYNALLADAEVQPANWNLQGRQADLWKQLGYIPQDFFDAGGANSKQVSRTLEHAYNDFAISQVSKLLGKSDDAEKYSERAGNFQNVWNPDVTVPGGPSSVIGMAQPRFSNGTFNYTDPRHCSVNDPTHSTCYLNAANRDGFYESSPLVYSQFVPQDAAKLIELQGGIDNFVSRLDFLFDEKYFDPTDEPSFQIPFMYHYANRPGFSTQRSRITIVDNFNTSVYGIPGNDDSGAMGSWATFFLLGLYPVPATQQYLLSSPFFNEVSIFNPVFNSTTTIRSNNFDSNSANVTTGNIYVQNVTVNGEPYKSNCYLDWDVFTNGSLVELTLTDDINVNCGSGSNALPPSLSTGGFD